MRARRPAGRSSPTRPRRDRRSWPRPRPGPAGRRTRSPVELPRDDGPHDRLTEWWYYTGHLQAANGARYGFEDVIFRAERGAFPTSWVSHLAITDETGGRFLYSQRLETGPQVDRSPASRRRGAGRLRPGAHPGAVRRGQRSAPAPWSMSGGGGTDHLVAALTPDEAALAGVAGRSRARPGAPVDQARGPARRRRLDRLRAGRRLVLLLADVDDRVGHADRSTARPLAVHRIGLVRPPVGRLHLGRRRRLGLVRGQPRRRHGPDPVARSRRRRQLPPDLRDGRRRRRDRQPPRSAGVQRPASPVTGRARRPAPPIRPAGRSPFPGLDLAIELDADRGRPGARHAGDDRRRVLGGIAARRPRHGTAAGSAARPMSS